jgi:hypothetical protein
MLPLITVPRQLPDELERASTVEGSRVLQG